MARPAAPVWATSRAPCRCASNGHGLVSDEHYWTGEDSPLWNPSRNGSGASVAVSAVDALEGDEEFYYSAALPLEGAAAGVAELTPSRNGSDPQSSTPFAVTLGEFIAKPRPDVPALITDTDGRPLVAKFSLNMLGARGGRGKTTLFVDLMVHAALGLDYLGFIIPAPVTVLLIENEGPENLFAEKLEERLGLLSPADRELVGERVHVQTLDWGGFNLGNRDTFDRLAAFLEEHPKDLIFGDPLDSLGIEGVGSPEDTRRFLALMKQAGLNKTNAWWLNTHPRKEATTDALDEIAGAWGGKPDLVMLLDMLADDRSRLRFPKVRWAKRGKRETILLGYEPDTATFTYLGTESDAERDYVAEIAALLADGKWRTAREISVKQLGGIGSNDQLVRERMTQHPDHFVSRTGDDAVQLGRRPNAVVWQLAESDGPEHDLTLVTPE